MDPKSQIRKNVNVLTKAYTMHKLTALLFVYYTKKIIDTT